VPREELRHALEARRELGPEYEDEIVEALAAKLEQRRAGHRLVCGALAVIALVTARST
jgi:hypothetical protein